MFLALKGEVRLLANVQSKGLYDALAAGGRLQVPHHFALKNGHSPAGDSLKSAKHDVWYRVLRHGVTVFNVYHALCAEPLRACKQTERHCCDDHRRLLDDQRAHVFPVPVDLRRKHVYPCGAWRNGWPAARLVLPRKLADLDNDSRVQVGRPLPWCVHDELSTELGHG